MNNVFYEKLENVKVIEVNKNHHQNLCAWDYVFGVDHSLADNKQEQNDVWSVIHHKVYKKWIITNDINQAGLKDAATSVEVVGYSDNIDGAMYIVWEHQKSLGMEHTVYEEIKEKQKQFNKIHVNDSEWKNWGVNEEIKINLNGMFTRKYI